MYNLISFTEGLQELLYSQAGEMQVTDREKGDSKSSKK